MHLCSCILPETRNCYYEQKDAMLLINSQTYSFDFDYQVLLHMYFCISVDTQINSITAVLEGKETTAHFIKVCQRLFGDNFFITCFLNMTCVNICYVVRNEI